MTKTNVELIKEMVARAKNLPNVIIEYNMKLPKEVTADDFFGVKAKENKGLNKPLNLTYKY